MTLELKEVPLPDALRMIDRQADLGLAFTSDVVPASKLVSLSAKHMPAGDALKRVLEGTGIRVRQTPSGQLMLVKTVSERARPSADTSAVASILVHVIDSTGSKPLLGVSIAVTGTSITATSSDQGGSYQGYAILRHVPSGLRIVTARYLGYVPVERQVVVPDTGYVDVEMVMHMSMTRLQEVVTTAAGQRRRYELANDITILNADSIVRTQPISSVTDLLEGRVPGLTVQHTSGAPGDPSRLRLRGTSSVLRSNDPIVILDGIRVYAAQSDSLSANVATGRGSIASAAPSPLDQIDPQAIETIEVLKGPSAATLYGPDAANGVIVITTKRGHPGPARWTASLSRGTTYIPGKYAVGLYRWGHDFSGNAETCALTDFSCQPDSLVRFQALNDKRYSPLGNGASTQLSLGVSGGSEALTYSVTGSYDDDDGLLGLPDVEVSRFETLHDGTEPTSWMRHPQQHTRWSGNSNLVAKIGDRATASLTTSLTRERQQRSTLEQQISTLLTTYIDPTTGTYWRGAGTTLTVVNELLPDFYRRVTDDATNFTNAANITWRPRSWLTTSADGGINVISRQDAQLLPRSLIIGTDSAGLFNMGTVGSTVSTVNLRATATAPLPWGFHLQFSTGANYTKTSQSTLETGATDLAPGTSSLDGAGVISYANNFVTDVTSFGWYVEPDFTHDRFTISTGLRLDGSSTFGQNVSLPVFPKIGVSWLISQEPFFPFKHFFDVVRLRAAYGRAGVWPGPGDRLRLYTTVRPYIGGGFEDATQVSTLGNTELRPERSSEMEGGFDADLLHSRLSIGFSGYRKMRYDALMEVPVAPSVYGDGVQTLRNIGVIRNTGVELSFTTQLLRTDAATLSTSLNLSRNHNMVTQLGKGVLPFGPNDARVAAGYPLFGRWARPILSYADVNGDGVIEQSEVLLGDSLAFMGASEPNYEANLFTTLSLLRGTLTLNASLAYQNGMTQINSTIGGPGQAIFSPGASDPSSSFGEQAAIAVLGLSDYGVLQTVSTLRLNAVSVAFNVSPSLASHFRARALTVALEGTNLGLWSNYAGKDPNVNAFSTGNSVIDSGVLPQPRTWRLSIRAAY